MEKARKFAAIFLCMVMSLCCCPADVQAADEAPTVTMEKAGLKLDGNQGLRFVISLTQFDKAEDYGIEISHNGKTIEIAAGTGYTKLSRQNKKTNTAQYAAVVTDITDEYQDFEVKGFVTYIHNGKSVTKWTKELSVSLPELADEAGCIFDAEAEEWVKKDIPQSTTQIDETSEIGKTEAGTDEKTTEQTTSEKTDHTNSSESTTNISEEDTEKTTGKSTEKKTDSQTTERSTRQPVEDIEVEDINGFRIAKMDDGIKVEAKDDGSILLSFTDFYQKIYFALPAGKTAEDYFSASVDVNIEEQFGFAITDIEGNTIKEDYPGYEVTYSSEHSYTLSFDAPSANGQGTMADGRLIRLQTLKNVAYGNEGKHANIILKKLDLVERKASETEGKTLLEAYGSIFGHVGNAGDLANLQNPHDIAYYKTEYNSFTLGNQMKPDYILRKNGEKTLLSTSSAKKQYHIPDGYTEDTVPELYFDVVDETLKLAQENGIQMRGHTLIWHQQTPTWFFKEGYDDNGAYVTPEVMNERIKFYVTNVMEHICNGPYKDVIYAWDVTNEYFHQGTDKNKSGWVGVYGDDIVENGKLTQTPEYVKIAFAQADAVLRETGLREQVHLFYNDYNTYEEVEDCIALIRYLNEQDSLNEQGDILCDGIGMQSHLDVMYPSVENYTKAMDKFRQEGLEIQITELDVTLNMLGNQNNEEEHVNYWKELMEGILAEKEQGANITAFVIWGMFDAISWRSQYTPLLWGNSYYDRKPAYQLVIDAADTYLPTIKPDKTTTESISATEKQATTAKTTEKTTEQVTEDTFGGFTLQGADEGVTTQENADGSITLSFTDKYQSAYFAFPKGSTAKTYVSISVDVGASEQFSLCLTDFSHSPFKDNYPGYDLSSQTRAKYPVDLTAGEEGVFIRFMTLENIGDHAAKNTPITVYGIDAYCGGDVSDNAVDTDYSIENEMKAENILCKYGSDSDSGLEYGDNEISINAFYNSEDTEKTTAERDTRNNITEDTTSIRKTTENTEGGRKTTSIRKTTEDTEGGHKTTEETTSIRKTTEDTEGGHKTTSIRKTTEDTEGSRKTTEEDTEGGHKTTSIRKTTENAEGGRKTTEDTTSIRKTTENTEGDRKTTEGAVSKTTEVTGSDRKTTRENVTNPVTTEYKGNTSSIQPTTQAGNNNQNSQTTAQAATTQSAQTTTTAKVKGLKASASKTKIRLTWKKMKDVTGYQIYRYNAKKKKYTLYKSVRTNSIQVKKLQKNTVYKFKVRAYKTVDGKKVYGAYTQKKIRTKK